MNYKGFFIFAQAEALKLLTHRLPAIVQPEPLLGMLADMLLQDAVDRLLGRADVSALVLRARHLDGRVKGDLMRAVLLARDEPGDDTERAIAAGPGTQFVGLPKKSSTMPSCRFVS